jgi:ribosomal protein S18 acetylase RimI-like enzyme
MVSIIRLTPSDATLLATIGGTTLIESHGHSAPAQVMQEYVDKSFSTETCLAELMDGNNIFHAVFYNNEPAGYSKIVFDCPHPALPLQPVTKLERLYLLNQFYDLKLGHQLLQQAIDLSSAQGEQGMWLNVWKENERAIRFYQKQGFETVGESEFVLTPTHANPNWVMLLRY